MGDTTIAWTDKTWNPVRGCSRVSSGCEQCYAERQAHRFSGEGMPYEGLTRLTKHGPVWTGKIRTVPAVLAHPLRWKKPQRIFVNSMSDLFHESVPPEFILRVFDTMLYAPQHTFQILTKRPKRMFQLIDDLGFNGKNHVFNEGQVYKPLPNVWLGVSCEDQPTAEERIWQLLQTPAAVRFVSLEPLLGPIDVGEWLSDWPRENTLEQIRHGAPTLDWIIVGGESGPNARPCNIAWIRSIVEQCKAGGVSCFVKQLGARVHGDPREFPTSEWAQTRAISGGPNAGYIFPLQHKKGGDWNEWPEDLRVREFPT